MSSPNMTYEELVGMISGVHDTDKVRSAYKRIARHLFLSRPDLINDLVLVEQAHEKTIRKAYGLQAKVDRLEEENNTYRHKLYKRGKGDYR